MADVSFKGASGQVQLVAGERENMDMDILNLAPHNTSFESVGVWQPGRGIVLADKQLPQFVNALCSDCIGGQTIPPGVTLKPFHFTT